MCSTGRNWLMTMVCVYVCVLDGLSWTHRTQCQNFSKHGSWQSGSGKKTKVLVHILIDDRLRAWDCIALSCGARAVCTWCCQHARCENNMRELCAMSHHSVGDNSDAQILQHAARSLDLPWRHALQYVSSCTMHQYPSPPTKRSAVLLQTSSDMLGIWKE